MGESVDDIFEEMRTAAEKKPAPPTTTDLSTDTIFETLRDARKDQDAAKLGLSMQYGSQLQPDQATRIIRLQGKTGLPPDLIERHLEEIERETKRADFDPVRFRSQNPVVAKWLSEHPNHAAAASQDIEKLSYLERQIRHMGQQFKIGMRTNELVNIGTSAINGTITPAQRKRQKELEEETSQATDYGITGFVESIPGAIANFAPMFGQTLIAKAGYGGLTAMGGAAMGGLIAGPPGAIAGAELGYAAGSHYGTALEIARQETSLAYLDYEKIKDENGNPIDRQTALGAAAVVGVINGVLGSIPFERLASKIGGLFSRQQIKQLLKNPTTRAAFGEYAKEIGAQMTLQGGLGVVQQMVRSTSAELLKMSEDGSLENKSSSQLLARVFSPENREKAWEMGKVGAQIGAVTGLTAIPDLAKNLRNVKNAEFTSAAFTEVGKQTKDLQILEKLPEETGKIMEGFFKDGPLETIYVPRETWKSYWQKKNVDPRAVAEEVLGETKSYDQGEATNEDLAIPTAKYATKIAPTEHNAFFVNELRDHPNSMNAREAREYVAKLREQEQAQEEAKKAQPEAPPTEEQRRQAETQQIKQKVKDQLTSIGFDEETAETYAQIYEPFGILAQRFGQSPEEIFSRYKLDITRPEERSPWEPPVSKQSSEELGTQAQDILEEQIIESHAKATGNKVPWDRQQDFEIKSKLRQALDPGDVIEVTKTVPVSENNQVVNKTTTHRYLVQMENGRLVASDERNQGGGLEPDSGMHFF